MMSRFVTAIVTFNGEARRCMALKVSVIQARYMRHSHTVKSVQAYELI